METLIPNEETMYKLIHIRSKMLDTRNMDLDFRFMVSDVLLKMINDIRMYVRVCNYGDKIHQFLINDVITLEQYTILWKVMRHLKFLEDDLFATFDKRNN